MSHTPNPADPIEVPKEFPTGFTFGIVITDPGQLSPDWQHLDDAFATLEADGCDTLWFTDHVFAGYPAGDALVLAAVAATATSTCRIGSGVLQLPLRQPSVVAKSAATLQLLSSGRFILGVGVGQHRREFDLVGAPFEDRGRRFDAALVQLRDCWNLNDDWFAQRPRPAPIPLWIGGHTEVSLRRAASSGDGWIPLFLSPSKFASMSRILDEQLEEAGRPRSEVVRAMMVLTSTTDRGWSRDDALTYASRLFPSGSSGLHRLVITGSAPDCADQLEAFLAAGAQHIAILPVRPDCAEMCAELSAAVRARAHRSR